MSLMGFELLEQLLTMRLSAEIQEEQVNSFPRLGFAVVAETCLLKRR